MAVEYQNKSEVKVTANATSITIPVPTGFSAGDLLIAIVTKDDDPAIVLPTGGTWTLIQSGTGADPQMHFSVSYRIAVAGDTSWTWTGDNEQWYGVILRYTGQASSGFIHASGKADGDSTTPTAPSVSYTDLEAGSLALHCFGQDYDRIPYTSPDGLIERYSGDAAGCGGAGGEKTTIIDSYDKANTDAETSINNIRFKVGQSFTATTDTLGFAKFYIYKVGSPVGNIVAKLYSHSGTYGSSSVPNTLLATSDALSLADMPTVPTLITFTFTGANKYSLTNGTKYCITIESDDCDATNYIRVQWDSSSPTHSGNALYYTTSWIALNTSDTIFYVLSANVVISGSGSTGTAIFTAGTTADEWLAVTVVIEAGIAGEQIKKIIDEVLNISELKNYFRGRYKIENEVVDIVESKNYLRTLTRIINEVVNIAELKIKLMALLKVVSETLNIEQAKNYIRGRLQVVSEVLNTVETVVKLVVVEGQDIIKVISETLNISELKNYIRNRLKVISETINIGELKNYLRSLTRIISEVVNVGEIIVKLRDRLKVISETLNIGELKNYIRGRLRVVSETINISELYNKLKGLFRVISEAVNVSEAKNYIRNRFKVISEIININELKNYWRALTRIVSEVVNVFELKNKLRTLIRVIDETLNISETIVKIVAGIEAIIKVINETLNISEARNYLRNRFKIINETINISEIKVKLRSLFRVMNETLNIDELKIKLRGIFKVISEVVNISELQNKLKGFIKVISEAINISELKNKIKGFFKVINETISISELKNYIIRIWTAISKMSTIWTPKEKEDTTWSPESKEDTTWTPKDKEDTIWTPQDKEDTTWTEE